MRVEKATKDCNALLSPAGHYDEFLTISVIHADGNAVEWTQHGVYADRDQAMYVAHLTCGFLNDIKKARGFFTHDDAIEAHHNARNALMRRSQRGW